MKELLKPMIELLKPLFVTLKPMLEVQTQSCKLKPRFVDLLCNWLAIVVLPLHCSVI